MSLVTIQIENNAQNTNATALPSPYGAKYDRALSLKEISEKIREDIKTAKKEGLLPKELKCSVRAKQHGGGYRTIDLTVTAAPFKIKNPGREAQDARRGFERGEERVERYTEQAEYTLGILLGIYGAYNYDKSDPSTDYYHCNYGGGVGYHWELP